MVRFSVSQARCLARRLAYQRRCVWAVSIIHKYFKGWVVRKEYRNKFRARAGPKIIHFLQQALVSNHTSISLGNKYG